MAASEASAFGADASPAKDAGEFRPPPAAEMRLRSPRREAARERDWPGDFHHSALLPARQLSSANELVAYTGCRRPASASRHVASRLCLITGE